MSKNLENIDYWMNWLEYTPDIIFFKDLEGVYRGVSKSTAILAGFQNADEMIGKNDYDIYPTESAETFRRQDREVIESGNPNLVEDWLEHATKGLIKIETLKAPLYDKDGKLLGIQGISRDVTEKYNYEKTIKDQQSQIKTLTENIPFPIWLKDIEGNYLLVNKSYEEFYGVKLEEIKGLKPLNLLQKNNIFSPEETENLRAEDEKILKEKTIIHSTNMIKIDGKDHYVEITKSPILDNNGDVIGIAGISRDVTEKYNYEKTIRTQRLQLNAVINNIPFPIWLKDTDGRYLLINKAYGSFLRLTKEDVIGSKSLEVATKNKYYDISLVEEFASEDKKVIEEKIVINTAKHTKLFGKEYFVEITKCPILDNNGEAIGIAGISVDMTNHKLYEDELVEARLLAEESNRTKSEFLANMSHEIRTPMNGIMGFIQLLSETILNDEQKDFVNEAKKSSEILLKLLNDVLDLSKIEAGKMTMESISFNIRYVIEDVATLASSNASKKNIEMSALCHSNVPNKVIGDPCRLKQVLNNFVNNAIKFTENGEIIISVKLLEKENENRKVKLLFEVKDTGIGISQENQTKIFEAFTQADSSTTRKYGGTGLGLTISKNIINMMNGEVSVTSKENEGSTFSFTAEFEVDNSKDETKMNYKNLQGLNILVVDDNKTNLNVLRHYLKEFKVKTFSAYNAKEAMDILNSEENNIDIILTDYCMPEKNGIEFAQDTFKIKKYRDIPIVLLTSRAQRGDYKVVKENNLRGYLPKPIRKNDLIECVSMLASGEQNKVGEEKTIITRHTIKEKHISEDVKILLVEDNPLNQKLTIKMLNKAGYSCDLANNGVEAMTALNNKVYDIVFMDCQMPVMDGYEATARIRNIEQEQNLNHTPIVALTANAMHGDINDCKKAGMDDYLAKPIIYENLIEKIKLYSQKCNENFCPGKNEECEANCCGSNQYKEDIIKLIVDSLGIDRGDAKELLDEFLIDLDKTITKMDDEFRNGNFAELAQLAHSIKGASGNLRITQIYELTAKLEQCAKNNLTDEIPDLLTQIKFDFEELSQISCKN